MAKGEKISDFEIAVCEEYLVNGLKKTEAYKAVSPKTLTPQSLRTTSWRLFARPQVREYLEERLRPIILSTNQTLAGLSELAETAENDRDRIRAYELIGKYHKLFLDRTSLEDPDGNPLQMTSTIIIQGVKPDDSKSDK